MTERAISYLLLFAATTAVLIVAVIQPRNTLIQKQRMLQGTNPNLAQTCTMGNMTCDQYQEMLCNSQGGTWNSAGNPQCAPPPTTCGNGSCTAEMCQMAGFGYDPATQSCTSFTNNSSSGGVAAGVVTHDGISDSENKKLITDCLRYVALSGYKETSETDGWFPSILNPANNACRYAYLATQGKYGYASDKLSSIYALLLNATEPVGILYRLLEKTPAPKEGQSITQYIDPNEEGAAKYLSCIEKNMRLFFTTTSLHPLYLSSDNPAKYVSATAAEEANKRTPSEKIISLEEDMNACLPKAEEKIIEEPVEPVVQKQAEEPVAEPVLVVRAAEPAAAPSLLQRVETGFTKVVNRLKEIRERGEEAGIERATIPRDIDTMRSDFLRTLEVIETFTTCREEGVC